MSCLLAAYTNEGVGHTFKVSNDGMCFCLSGVGVCLPVFSVFTKGAILSVLLGIRLCVQSLCLLVIS